MEAPSVVSRGEAAKVFERVEAALDPVAQFVDGPVMRDEDLARGDYGAALVHVTRRDPRARMNHPMTTSEASQAALDFTSRVGVAPVGLAASRPRDPPFPRRARGSTARGPASTELRSISGWRPERFWKNLPTLG